MSTANWKKPICVGGHKLPPRNKNGACVLCVQVNGKKRYENNKDVLVARAIARNKMNPEVRRDEQRAWRLGVPVADVRKAIAEAKGQCGCCSKRLTHRQMCVDHCHATGRIRGVLCVFCNALDGMLHKQAERVSLLKKYLRRARRRNSE